MTHSLVMRFCTCEALKTPKLQKKKKRDTPSSTTPNSMTWVCGAAKFSLEQVSDEERVEEEGTGCGHLCS